MDTSEPPHQSRERTSFHHAVREIYWFSIAVVTTFLSIYAIRLIATPVELGWRSVTCSPIQNKFRFVLKKGDLFNHARCLYL